MVPVIYMPFFCFDFIIQCTWFNFQGQLTMYLKHDFFWMGLQKLHKVLFSMLLSVHVFTMVKLGFGVAVMVWSNLKQIIVSLLTKTLVKLKNNFYKLKNKHIMKSCLWNWSATKIFGSLGVKQQVHGHLKN